MSDAAVRAERVGKRFGDAVALTGVSFELEAGGVVGVLGPAGAGKSTLLRALVGLVRLDEGRVEVLGRPYRRLERPATRLGAALGAELPRWRSAGAHLRVCAVLAGVSAGRVEVALEDVGLRERAARRPGRLTDSERALLRVAAALLAEPELLLVDEPALSFDAQAGTRVRDLIRERAEAGATVLITSDRLSDLTDLAERVLVLDRGRLIADRPLVEVMRHAGSEVVVRSPGAEVLGVQLERTGVQTARVSSEEVRARDVAPSVVSELAVSSGLPLREVRTEPPGLEDVLHRLAAEPDASANGARSPGPRDDPELADAERAAETGMARLPAVDGARVVVVASAEPGAGATTLCFAVADAAACHLGMRTLAAALGPDRERLTLPVPASQRSPLRLDDLLRDLERLDEGARIGPYVSVAHSGLHTLSGPADGGAPADLDEGRLERLIAFMGRFYELILLDVAGLPEPVLHTAVNLADEVVLVGGAEPSDRPAGSPVLDAIESRRTERATLVINRADARHAAERARDPTPAWGIVPEDRELIRSLDGGDYRLADQAALTRTALKRLSLLVAEGVV